VTSLTSDKLAGKHLETWNSYLMATRILFDTLDSALTEQAGISLPDYIVLFRLSQSGDEGTRMSELADAAVFSRSRISHAFRRLEEEGWVERRACPTDRRGSFGYLTDAGQHKLDVAETIHTDVVERYFLAPLGESEETFGQVTNRMLEALGAAPSDPTC
jgi:DNA-binding MarR family transcriptional regulator